MGLSLDVGDGEAQIERREALRMRAASRSRKGEREGGMESELWRETERDGERASEGGGVGH